VLWDLDGTLADSTELHWCSWQVALEAEGVPITRERFLASFGQRNEEILSSWLGPEAGAENIRRVGDAKEGAYRALVKQHGLDPLPGAAEWVRALHEAGWRQAIASSGPRANVQVMHEALGLGAYIETLVAAEDVSRGKPDPEVLLTAARRLGVGPDRSIVVEDARAGIEAALRGGMRSIAVGGGAGEDADIVVASLTDLPPDTFDRLVPGG
jgi:HAD superfamily hydrolase (TIGR01509 family)